jgi:hypothetical protein
VLETNDVCVTPCSDGETCCGMDNDECCQNVMGYRLSGEAIRTAKQGSSKQCSSMSKSDQIASWYTMVHIGIVTILEALETWRNFSCALEQIYNKYLY